MQKKNEKTSNTAALDSLITLVRSLTPAQKRDFKKYVRFWNTANDQKYLQLFDAVNDWLSKGKDESLMMGRVLHLKIFADRAEASKASAYCSDKILTAMRQMSDHATYANKLSGWMQDINFLFDKSLFEDCLLLINKALDLAKRLDKPTYMLELLSKKQRIYFRLRTKDWTDLLQEVLREEQEAIEKMKEYAQINEVGHHMTIVSTQKKPIPTDLEAKMIQLVNPERKISDSPRAKLRLEQVKMQYYDYLHKNINLQYPQTTTNTGYLRMAQDSSGRALQVLRDFPILGEEDPKVLLTNIQSHINISLRLGDVDAVLEAQKLMPPNLDEETFISNILSAVLQTYLVSRKYKDGLAYIGSLGLTEKIRDIGNQIHENRLLSLYYTVGQLYFVEKTFAEAGDWFERILNEPRSQNRPDIRILASIMNLICKFESGQFDEDEDDPIRPVENLTRKFRRDEHLDDFHKTLFDALEMAFLRAESWSKKEFREKIEIAKNSAGAEETLKTYGFVFGWLESIVNKTELANECEKYF